MPQSVGLCLPEAFLGSTHCFSLLGIQVTPFPLTPLSKLQFKWNRYQILQRAPRQIRLLQIKYFLVPSHSEENIGNWAVAFSRTRLNHGGKEVRAMSELKWNEISCYFECSFFLSGCLLGYCRSLTVFQSSCKITVANLYFGNFYLFLILCLSFKCFCRGWKLGTS